MKTPSRFLAYVLLAAPSLTSSALAAEEEKAVIIELTQVPCQFIESEQGTNHGYRSSNIKDCEAINAKSGASRVKNAKPLQLKAGKTIFRVTNRDVPYELAFWLRGDGIAGRVTLPSVSGGGLLTGQTQDYVIDLKPGEYVYSCPLNTTPDYKLVVN